MELVHFRDSFRDWFMIDGNAVSRDHHAGTICATLAMNKYLGLWVRANQVEKFNNLGTRGLIVSAPRNPDVFHSQGFNLALLGRHFPAFIAEIDDNSDPHRLQRPEPIQTRLAPAVKRICNTAEVREASYFFSRLAPRDLYASSQRHDCQNDSKYDHSRINSIHPDAPKKRVRTLGLHYRLNNSMRSGSKKVLLENVGRHTSEGLRLMQLAPLRVAQAQ
jgi:hypothetical protein